MENGSVILFLLSNEQKYRCCDTDWEKHFEQLLIWYNYLANQNKVGLEQKFADNPESSERQK